MKIYKHIQMVQSEDLSWFTENVVKVTNELQNLGLLVELDYKPLMTEENKVFNICMIKAYEPMNKVEDR